MIAFVLTYADSNIPQIYSCVNTMSEFIHIILSAFDKIIYVNEQALRQWTNTNPISLQTLNEFFGIYIGNLPLWIKYFDSNDATWKKLELSPEELQCIDDYIHTFN